MLNNKMSEYNALCEEIKSLESQMPSMEEIIASEDAAEKDRKIRNKIKDLEKERSFPKEWLSGYMAACEDMQNIKTRDEIATILGE